MAINENMLVAGKKLVDTQFEANKLALEFRDKFDGDPSISDTDYEDTIAALRNHEQTINRAAGIPYPD